MNQTNAFDQEDSSLEKLERQVERSQLFTHTALGEGFAPYFREDRLGELDESFDPEQRHIQQPVAPATQWLSRRVDQFDDGVQSERGAVDVEPDLGANFTREAEDIDIGWVVEEPVDSEP